ncbi:pol, partial [Symbiodinium pilosum]
AVLLARHGELLQVALQAPRQSVEPAKRSFRLEQSGQQAHVWLPDAPVERMPLLLVLHGSRPMDWDFLSFTERFERDARQHRVAIVVPESRGPTWDYLLTGQRQDMDFIEFAINEVRRRVPIDGRRIAVMGMSDGGSIGLSVALRNPSLFRTALVQAVGFYVDTRSDQQEQPQIFLEYGAKDRLFTPEGVAKPLVSRLRAAGYSVEFSMVPEAGHMVREEFFAVALDFWLSEGKPRSAETATAPGYLRH